MSRRVALVLLLVCVIASALQVVVQRHQARKLFAHSQELNREIIELGREWGQLLLEQGTWGTHGRVEDIARDRLDMTIPDIEKIHRIRS